MTTSMDRTHGFHFHTKDDQTILLGRKAKNTKELLEGIKIVPDSSIYYHTHKYLQQHHYLSPEPPNDFAYWVTNVLNEEILGEQISSIDIIQFHRISDLRKKFIEIIEEYIATSNRIVDAPQGEEFYFMSSQTFVLRTPYIAFNLRQFKEILSKVSIHSIYFHVFDAHLRLEHGENDFSIWLRHEGKETLANAIMKLDPYTQTLEGLRRKIIHLVENHDPD